MITTKDLFDYQGTLAEALLSTCLYPWEALPRLKAFILELQKQLPASEYRQLSEDIFVHRSAVVAESACIKGPAIIGAGTEIRHCAFIRGSALVGENCVVGNSTELKNTLMLNHVQAPHYNYTGDSIFGNCSHTGAGVITSNVKSDKSLVILHCGDEVFETGLKKFGAMIGDHVEVGCNSVLNPGTVLGRECRVYPLSMVRGIVPARSIYKKAGEIVKIR